MLVRLHSNNFPEQFLSYVAQDPVHGLTAARSLERRCNEDREIFFMVDNGLPVAILCAAYTNGLINDVADILDTHAVVETRPTHAIFYSVFRTDVPYAIKNAGASIINEAADWLLANRPEITNFVTMSPIPDLSAHFSEKPSDAEVLDFLLSKKDAVARFHQANGATVLRVIPDADSSDKRLAQSYGIMVNYVYR